MGSGVRGHNVQVSVVNTGFRPIILHEVYFEQDDSGGYPNQLDENLGLPKRLDEGEQHVLSFHAEDATSERSSGMAEERGRRVSEHARP